MKKLLFSLVLGMVVLSSAPAALADTVISLREVEVNPRKTVTCHFPEYGTVGTYAGEYILEIENQGLTSGFCVEDTLSSSSFQSYELLAPGSLGVEYLEAAWIANEYHFGNHGWTAWATQIAIWEVVLDPGDYDASVNGFRANSYVSGANAIIGEMLAAADSDGFSDYDFNGWQIARSPYPYEDNTAPQDYLVRVPEPGTTLLLGAGAFSLMAARRRRKA